MGGGSGYQSRSDRPRIGKTHLQHDQAMPDVDIAAVADVDGRDEAVLGTQCRARAYTDALELLHGGRLDAAGILTAKRHAPSAIAAIKESGRSGRPIRVAADQSA